MVLAVLLLTRHSAPATLHLIWLPLSLCLRWTSSHDYVMLPAGLCLVCCAMHCSDREHQTGPCRSAGVKMCVRKSLSTRTFATGLCS